MFRLLPAALATLTLALPAAAGPLTPVQTAALSARVYAAGVEAADPVLILAAARLRKTIHPEPVARLAEGGEVGTVAPLGWEAMSAADRADGDAALLGLIDELRTEGTRGVAAGPVDNIGSLGKGRTDTYRDIDFKGGE